MRFHRRLVLSVLLLACYLVVAPRPASAAASLVNGSGILTGAAGVNVNGTLYDVEFVDDTRAAVFDGCDSVNDFAFTTLADAAAASDALGVQVFVDGPSGQFDSFPNLTFGCIDAFICNATTPFALTAFTPEGGIEASTFGNWSVASGLPDGSNHLTTINFKPDTSSEPFSVYARWTPSTVPEPATLSLLGVGLVSMAVRRWRAAHGVINQHSS
jgi:hypothetical protein